MNETTEAAHHHLKTTRRRAFLGLSASLTAIAAFPGCNSVPTGPWYALAESYSAVVADPIRTEQDRTMDARRHPAELLSFTQVKPGMQVLDVAAGGGYTSQLLAIAVGPSGTVWAQAQRPSPIMSKRLADQPQKNLVYLQRPFDDPVPPEAPKLDLIARRLPAQPGRPARRLVESAEADRQVRAALRQALGACRS